MNLTHRISPTALVFLLIISSFAQLPEQSKERPILKHYDQEHINKFALPVGGIGTGTISLGGTGDFRDWEIMNKPAKEFVGMNPLNLSEL